MESFIRSKYETRRWAMEGPPPNDPSVLDSGSSSGSNSAPAPAPAPTPQTVATQTTRQTHTTSGSISSPVGRQPQGHPLLSANYGRASASPAQVTTAAKPQAPPPVQVQPPQSKPADDIFSLDFHAPAASSMPPAQAEPKKDVKNDILSLFNTPSAAALPNPAFSQTAMWGGIPQVQQQQPQQPSIAPTGMMGMNGVGVWGASSGWQPPPAPVQPNIWSATPQQQQQSTNLFDTNSIWGGTAVTGGTQDVQKKETVNDAFADIWK